MASTHLDSQIYVWWDELGLDVQPTFAVPGYAADESDNLTPALKRAGYTIHSSWFTGDGDSFGPLTRCVRAIDPKGDRVIVVYG